MSFFLMGSSWSFISSKEIYVDSSSNKVLLLKTLYALLDNEYPKKIAPSTLDSNLPKLFKMKRI